MSSYSEPDYVPSANASTDLDTHRQVSLCEVLDRLLNKGVVLAGEVVISVADIDLVYLNLQLLLTSIETASRGRLARTTGTRSPSEP
jgi:Gas vesicle protein